MSLGLPGNAVVVNFFMRFPLITSAAAATAIGTAVVVPKEEPKVVAPIVQVAPVVKPVPPPVVVVPPAPPPQPVVKPAPKKEVKG